MTIHEMRICYKDYAKKEREIESRKNPCAEYWDWWYQNHEVVDKAARDGKTEKEIEPGRESLPQPGSDPKPSKGDGDGG